MSEIVKSRINSIKRFYALMCEQINISLGNGDDIENQKVYDYIEATLHALFDMYEKLSKTQIDALTIDTKLKIKGLRFANNKLKHDKNHLRGNIISETFQFPMMFPINFNKNFVWADLSHLYNSKQRSDEDCFPLYNQFINGTEVRCVFKDIIDALEQEIVYET